MNCSLLHAGEASSHFEDEMAATFGEEESFDTHFCQWLVSISLHSTFRKQYFNPNIGCKS